MNIIKREIHDMGGVDNLAQHDTLKSVNGDIIYSSRINAHHMLKYRSATLVRMDIIDIYCDGATSSTSGSTIQRMSISNLRGRWHRWYDIGLCITLTDEALDDEKRRLEKHDMFQRFLYLAITAIINASFNGLYTKELLFVHCFGMLCPISRKNDHYSA